MQTLCDIFTKRDNKSLIEESLNPQKLKRKNRLGVVLEGISGKVPDWFYSFLTLFGLLPNGLLPKNNFLA